MASRNTLFSLSVLFVFLQFGAPNAGAHARMSDSVIMTEDVSNLKNLETIMGAIKKDSELAAHAVENSIYAGGLTPNAIVGPMVMPAVRLPHGIQGTPPPAVGQILCQSIADLRTHLAMAQEMETESLDSSSANVSAAQPGESGRITTSMIGHYNELLDSLANPFSSITEMHRHILSIHDLAMQARKSLKAASARMANRCESRYVVGRRVLPIF